MTPRNDTRDKVVALEVKVDNLTEKVIDLSEKVEELHNILIQAKGARWMLMFLVALGGFVAAKITPFLSYFFSK